MDPRHADLHSASIARRLVQARRQRNLTQSQTSLRAGLSRKTCFTIETRQADSSVFIGTVEKLADVLEVSAAWLAFGEGPAERPSRLPSPRCAGIAGRLREARLQAGLDQAELSVQAGLDRTTCLAIETRGAQVNVLAGTVEKLARVLGVAAGWLAFGQDDATATEPMAVGVVPAAPAGRFSHRGTRGYDYERDLPSLPTHFDPLLAVLGPGLDYETRLQVRLWLFGVLLGPDRAVALQALGELWVGLVPAEHHGLLNEVMAELSDDDPVRRGTLALQVLIDAGLPVSCAEMEAMIYREHPAALVPALDAAAEILFAAVPEDSLTWLHVPLCGGEVGDRLA